SLEPGGRRGWDPRWHRGILCDLEDLELAHAYSTLRNSGGGGVFSGGRALFRILPGAQGRTSRPHRSLAVRVKLSVLSSQFSVVSSHDGTLELGPPAGAGFPG